MVHFIVKLIELKNYIQVYFTSKAHLIGFSFYFFEYEIIQNSLFSMRSGW